MFLSQFILFLSPSLMRKDLPRTVIPQHYVLSLDAGLDSFSGSVTIHLNAEEPVTTFKFNSEGLKLSGLKIVKDSDSKPGTTIQASTKEEVDFVTVNLENAIQGKFTLQVNFSAEYSTSLEGFYSSKYNGDPMFSTHFEPADARKAFPCFDQPDMKATFDIEIRVPAGYIALSNEKEIERKEEGEKVLFRFARTPVMSTYIVAYVVGKLGYVEEKGRIPIRVYAHESEKEWGRFALSIAVKTLEFYEKYFDQEYPLSKLDMVAIPSFAAGAMENWGLVTYRKTSLLFDANTTSTQSKKNIAMTVAHELAHMWFGNLVTMKWWDDLWLNEGFATWAAALAIAESCQTELEWDVWTSFVSDEIEKGMSMDGRRSTHSVGSVVDEPVEVNQKFDAISYSKGSSIIKMVQNWMGADTFKKGLIGYIKKFKYGNAVTGDLWACLTEAAEAAGQAVDVAAVVGPWVSRPGFPYISITETEDTIELVQKRFTIGYESEGDEPWPIPIRILWMGKEPESKSYLMDKETLSIKKEYPLYKLNDEVSGFYRTMYPEKQNERLIQYNGLSTSNVMNTIADIFALSRALHAKIQTAVGLVDYLDQETNYEILSLAISWLSYFRSLFYDNKAKYDYFHSKLLGMIKERFESIKIEKKDAPTDINTIMLDSLVVGRAVYLRFEPAIERLRGVKREDLNPEYLRSYFMARVDQDFKSVFSVYQTSTRPGEKQSALVALGSTQVEENVDFLFKSLEVVEPQDSIYLFMSLSMNISFRNKAAMLFIENFERIRKHIGNAGLVRYSIESMLSAIYEEEFKVKVKGFLESLKDDREMKSAMDKCNDELVIGEKIRAEYNSVNLD